MQFLVNKEFNNALNNDTVLHMWHSKENKKERRYNLYFY